jgi:hypothetical protein
MQGVKGWRPNSGTVLGLIAIVIAVVGTANAAPSKVVVRKGDIAPGAVTARSIARGAVTNAKLRKASVTASKVAAGAVTSSAIAAGAVTSSALAPGSVDAATLATENIVVKPILDLDKDPHNGEWSPSNTELALCGPGEALLGGGFAFMTTGDGEVGTIEQMPLINNEVKGMQGRITSDAGGAATAQVAAVCLK